MVSVKIESDNTCNLDELEYGEFFVREIDHSILYMKQEDTSSYGNLAFNCFQFKEMDSCTLTSLTSVVPMNVEIKATRKEND